MRETSGRRGEFKDGSGFELSESRCIQEGLVERNCFLMEIDGG